MRCLRCEQNHPRDQKFCGECGTPLHPLQGAALPAPSYADMHRSLTEALDQQTATSEILRVISQSPTGTQPVFEIIARNAVRVCGATACTVFVLDGEMIRVGATDFDNPQWASIMRALYPAPISADVLPSQVIRECQVIHLADIEHNPRAVPATVRLSKAGGYRTVLSMPLVRDGAAIGAISVTRADAGPFSDHQIALLQTFADQAVIAIENVRLFTELQEKNWALTAAHAQVSESLEQQTATSEILRVISSSPTDLQPVLDAVAHSAARLCNANDALIYRLEGDRLELVAKFGPIPSATGSLPLTRGLATGRAVIDRQTLHIEDIATQLDEFPDAEVYVRRFNHHTLLITPLLREGVALGVIAIRRTEVRPFSDTQIALLKTFADQAVIAIENVRLFTELQEKNRALTQAHAQVTESLEQQTTTSPDYA
jgi:two-component system, NtrC family, sensor kinase